MRRSADLRKFLLVFLLLLTSCRHEPLREVFKRTEKLMGTFVEVCVVTADHEKAEAAINAAFRVMREAEGLMSVDLPESEISRLNAAGSLVVSPATFDCVEKALEAEQDCYAVLQTIAACRGAMNALMRQIMEGHVLHHVHDPRRQLTAEQSRATEALLDVIRTYLK